MHTQLFDSSSSHYIRPLGWWLSRGFSPTRLYRCDVVFGSPSEECRGTGICKILVSQSEQLPQAGWCRPAPALIYADPSRPGQLSLLLLREFVCVEAWRRHLRQGRLLLSAPVGLPIELSRFFDLDDSTELLSGAYPVEEISGYLRLELTCSPSIPVAAPRRLRGFA